MTIKLDEDNITVSPTQIDDTDSPYLTNGEQYIYVDTTNGPVTIQLASSDTVDGAEIRIIDTGESASTNTITIQTEGSENINPGSNNSITLTVDGTYVDLFSDGNNWFSDRRIQKAGGKVGTSSDRFTGFADLLDINRLNSSHEFVSSGDSIQSKANTLSSNGGGYLFITETVSETGIDVPADVSVVGLGMETTAVEANSDQYVFDITAGYSSLHNLTIDTSTASYTSGTPAIKQNDPSKPDPDRLAQKTQRVAVIQDQTGNGYGLHMEDLNGNGIDWTEHQLYVYGGERAVQQTTTGSSSYINNNTIEVLAHRTTIGLDQSKASGSEISNTITIHGNGTGGTDSFVRVEGDDNYIRTDLADQNTLNADAIVIASGATRTKIISRQTEALNITDNGTDTKYPEGIQLLNTVLSIGGGGTFGTSIPAANVGDTIVATASPDNDPGNDAGFNVTKIWYDSSAGSVKLLVEETENDGGGDARVRAWKYGSN